MEEGWGDLWEGKEKLKGRGWTCMGIYGHLREFKLHRLACTVGIFRNIVWKGLHALAALSACLFECCLDPVE
eukprot:119094-Alexandrium_andersonii.AAC.1